MADVSIRDLRNRGGEIVQRAQRGERLTITNAGTPVAELTGLPRPPVTLDELRRRREQLPPVDPAVLQRDSDDVIDPSL